MPWLVSLGDWGGEITYIYKVIYKFWYLVRG
jgi:hypothetical protein